MFIEFNEVRQDCIFFRGSIPCIPNKKEGAVCTCEHYRPVSKNILIIKLGAIGDVIRTTPLVVKYRKLYPDCRITWLTQFPAVLPSAEIDAILTPDAFSLLKIRESTFDIAVNLDKEQEACQLLALVNAKEKYGYTWENGRLSPATPAAIHKLMTGFFDQLSQENTKSYLEEIFEICHFTFEQEPYLIRKNEQLASEWMEKTQLLAKGKKVVGLNTGCGPRWNTRLWPEDHWKQLANKLADLGFFPVFLGGEIEHEKNTRLAIDGNAYYPGHFSLEEFIALTDSMDIIVTQVSMMMHIATALQKNMVLMNNIFNPHEFELYGRGEIIQPPIACICYFGNSCKNGESCMRFIPSDVISAAVERNSSILAL